MCRICVRKYERNPVMALWHIVPVFQKLLTRKVYRKEIPEMALNLP